MTPGEKVYQLIRESIGISLTSKPYADLSEERREVLERLGPLLFKSNSLVTCSTCGQPWALGQSHACGTKP